MYKNVAESQSRPEDPDFEKFRAFLRNLLIRGGGHRFRRRLHYDGRTTEPIDRQLHRMELC